MKYNDSGFKFLVNGIEIVLPIPFPSVNLRLGTFDEPVDVFATNSSGSIVRKRTILKFNRCVNMRLSATEITSLILTGGGDEALLVNICVSISV